MPRPSSGPVVLAIVLSSAAGASAQTLTCDPEQIRAESYRLTTVSQAANVTLERTEFEDGFDASLGTHRAALDELNGDALAIAERAREIDPSNLLAHSQVARQLIVDGRDGDRARDTLARVFDAGGAIVWTATLYDVDAKDFFLMAFTREGIGVFRMGEAAGTVERRFGGVPELPGPDAHRFWRAWGGCLDALRGEAFVPWADVHEIKAGNFVLYFKFRTPVTVASDRGKRKTLKELKVALHGAMGTVEYHVTPDSRWWVEPSVRGIGIGPSDYQDRLRRTLAAVVDPEGRIKLPKKAHGAGW